MGQVGLSPPILAVCVYFLMVSTSSKRQGKLIRFKEVTQDYMVACNAFSAITLLKYGESLVNYSSQRVKWQVLRLKSRGSYSTSLFMHTALIKANII